MKERERRSTRSLKEKEKSLDEERFKPIGLISLKYLCAARLENAVRKKNASNRNTFAEQGSRRTSNLQRAKPSRTPSIE